MDTGTLRIHSHQTALNCDWVWFCQGVSVVCAWALWAGSVKAHTNAIANAATSDFLFVIVRFFIVVPLFFSDNLGLRFWFHLLATIRGAKGYGRISIFARSSRSKP